MNITLFNQQQTIGNMAFFTLFNIKTFSLLVKNTLFINLPFNTKEVVNFSIKIRYGEGVRVPPHTKAVLIRATQQIRRIVI